MTGKEVGTAFPGLGPPRQRPAHEALERSFKVTAECTWSGSIVHKTKGLHVSPGLRSGSPAWPRPQLPRTPGLGLSLPKLLPAWTQASDWHLSSCQHGSRPLIGAAAQPGLAPSLRSEAAPAHY